jgi:hypothetical protein
METCEGCKTNGECEQLTRAAGMERVALIVRSRRKRALVLEFLARFHRHSGSVRT